MKLFQMLLSQRNILEKYTPSTEATDDILSLFCETLALNLDEEGDQNLPGIFQNLAAKFF